MELVFATHVCTYKGRINEEIPYRILGEASVCHSRTVYFYSQAMGSERGSLGVMGLLHLLVLLGCSEMYLTGERQHSAATVYGGSIDIYGGSKGD